jgi:hypothetical protein
MAFPYIVSGLGVPTSIVFPDPLIAGDTWNFRMSTLKWPGCSASIVFAADATKLTSTATVVSNYFEWVIAGTQTATLIPGPYTYNVFMTDAADGSRYTAERGSVRVAADISDPNTLVTETTTPLQQMLAACDAALIRLLGQDTSMVQYGGQMYQFQDVGKLFSVRDQLQARVNDEADALRGQKNYRKIACVFTDF